MGRFLEKKLPSPIDCHTMSSENGQKLSEDDISLNNSTFPNGFTLISYECLLTKIMCLSL